MTIILQRIFGKNVMSMMYPKSSNKKVMFPTNGEEYWDDAYNQYVFMKERIHRDAYNRYIEIYWPELKTKTAVQVAEFLGISIRYPNEGGYAEVWEKLVEIQKRLVKDTIANEM